MRANNHRADCTCIICTAKHDINVCKCHRCDVARRNRAAGITSVFEQLVQRAKDDTLPVQQALTDVEAGVDKYIKEHKLAYVLDDGHYYTWYENTGEWLKLSWSKLRRDCPIVFAEANDYLIHQNVVMGRLKAHNRVYRSVRIHALSFE